MKKTIRSYLDYTELFRFNHTKYKQNFTYLKFNLDPDHSSFKSTR